MARSVGDLLARLEQFLPPRYQEAREVTVAAPAALALAELEIDELALASTVEGATDVWLDLLARGYGLRRSTEEPDAQLRWRLRHPEEQLTGAAIRASVDAILAQYTATPCIILEWWQAPHLDVDFLDWSGEFDLSADCRSFLVIVPLIGEAPWGEDYLDTMFLDWGFLGVEEHDVYTQLAAEINRLRAAGVRVFLVIDT